MTSPLASSDQTIAALHAASNQNEQDSFLSFDVTSAVRAAQVFHQEFSATMHMGANGVVAKMQPKWAKQLVHRRGAVAAIIEKAGSNAFVKRRPSDASAYADYVQNRFDAEQPIEFRIGFGPLKNRNCGATTQSPDLAEYLTLVQLSRMIAAVAALYPFGVKAHLVPDDKRTIMANQCCSCQTHSYISGLKKMVADLGFDTWLYVEDGQKRLYDVYEVPLFLQQAEESLLLWKDRDPASFAAKWETACDNAKRNIHGVPTQEEELESRNAAWRYLVAHQAEVLSGMWMVGEAFPLRYGHHVGSFQLFSMGVGKTKLPWQISLPFDIIDEDARPFAVKVAA